MLTRSEWTRSFKPKFSGEVLKVESIENGFVKSGGKRFDIARVLPTLANTRNTNIPPTLAAGSERKNERNKSDLQDFVSPLKDFLKNGGAKTTQAISKFLKEKPQFDEKLKASKLSVAAFVRLFPESFGILEDGRVSARLRKIQRGSMLTS